jgi:DNA-directed RNA polymerase subunit beta
MVSLKHLIVSNQWKIGTETEPIYLSAEEEEGMLIAQANVEIDKDGNITAENVIAKKMRFPVVTPSQLDYDVVLTIAY